MEQDRKKALDDKTRKLAGGKIEDGKEHSAYQEAQQQLLAIQAEQQQNLAVARAESKASFENNQTLAQAAELEAISAAEAEQAAMGAQTGGQLNPATQQILSKYGVGQPKFSRTQSHTQQVTKQNITINNNITSNTTNDVKVPANIGGPLQGRPLQFKTTAAVSSREGGGSVGKFKSWISAAFARQKEEGEKRDREYRHREGSLTKSANKMMKKLEEIGKTIGSRMDPRKIGSTWQSQLKTLLLLFGFGYLTSNWTKILSWVSNIEKWFKGDFLSTIKDYFSKVTGFFGIGKSKGEGESGFHKMIREFLGGKPGEGLVESFKKLLFTSDESLFGYIKLWIKNAMKERADAIKMIRFPQLDSNDIIGSIGKIGEYLKSVIEVLVNGTKGAEKYVTSQIGVIANRGALEMMENDEGTRNTINALAKVDGKDKFVKADKGALALLKDPETGEREHRGLTRYSLNNEGELTGSVESTLSQSVHLDSLYRDSLEGKRTFNTLDAARGIERLYKAAIKKKQEEGHGIPIDIDVIDLISTKLRGKLENEGKLKHVPYHIVTREKTDEDYAIEEANPKDMAIDAFANKAILDAVGLGEISDTIAKAKGAAAGATAGAVGGLGLGGPATIAIGGVGGGLGWLLGGALNSKEARAIKGLVKGTINKMSSNDYRVELERGKGASDEDTRYLWEITPEGVQDIANILTGDGRSIKTNSENPVNINITDKNFTSGVKNFYTAVTDRQLSYLRTRIHKEEEEEGTGNDLYAVLRKKALRLENSRAGSVDDADVQNLYGELDRLQELSKSYKKQEEEAFSKLRINNAFGGGGYNGNARSPYRATTLLQKQYIENMRPILRERLLSKSFVPEDEVEEYADILTAQSGLESGWGSSNLSRNYNNYSGMTRGTGKYHSTGTITLKNSRGEDKNTYETFERVNDWADDYVEYLNRKWKAFDKGPSEYYNQIQNNPNMGGQKYATDSNYIQKNKNALADVKSILGHPMLGNSTPTSQTTSVSQQVPSDLAIAAAMQTQAGTYEHRGKTKNLGINDYDGNCTFGVATFYRKAGGPELNGNWWNSHYTTATATNIGNVGFEEVWHGTREAANANEFGTPLPGDIMVQFGTKANNENSSHAQMWDGQHWVSDTIQMKDASHTGNTFVYNKGRMGDRSAILYRYTGNQTPATPITEEQRNTYYQQSGVSSTTKPEPKSFLEIFKEKAASLLTNFGGAFGAVGDALSPATDEIKSKILKNGYVYKGPITKEFVDYESYLAANPDKLPEELPAGLSSADWKNRVYDLTGSFPYYQDLKKRVVDDKDLREDSKKILEKFTKPEEKKIAENKIDNPWKEEELKAITPGTKLDDLTYTRLLNDHNFMSSLSPEAKADFLEDGRMPKVIEPTSIETLESDKSGSYLSIFDTKRFEKKEDKVDTIVGLVTTTNSMLEQLLGVETASGMANAQVVDAVNRNTVVNANASKNMARLGQVQQNNTVENLPSLSSPDKSLIGVV